MASRDDIKFLSNPNIGSQRKKYCRFKNSESDTSTTEILTSFYNSSMNKERFFQEESLETL